jgi:branched-chain amino acid transport system ATP-binding protein
LAILEVDKIDTYYGKSHVLYQLSLKVDESRIVALLGRNGVGKTTTLRSTMGLTPPRRGTIRFKNVPLQGMKPFEIAKLGMGFVPEDRGIFPEITVRDNLEIAAKPSPGGSRRWTLERVYQYFPILNTRRESKGKNLSGGEQQMLTIARTLMGNPDLVLLDEPCQGLAPQVVGEVFRLIKGLKENEKTPILLAEQNARFCLGLADWCYVIEKGVIQYSGSTESIKANAEIQKKYLAL